MLIRKRCEICGCEFTYPHWRKNVKYCSPDCRQEGLKGKPNAVCTNCGREFHIKKNQLERYMRTMGVFCSRNCMYEYKRKWFCGENNHQYGLKGDKNDSFKGIEIVHKNHRLMDIRVYAPEHPMADRDKRVLKHHLIVEENHSLFDPQYFDVVNDHYILKSGLVVHHKDGNHSNNDVSNLEIMTRGKHTSYHNHTKPMPKDKSSGRFINRSSDQLGESDRSTGI